MFSTTFFNNKVILFDNCRVIGLWNSDLKIGYLNNKCWIILNNMECGYKQSFNITIYCQNR